MSLQLSLSVRVAESFTNKRISTVPWPELARTAAEAGYDALCLRASVVSVDDGAERRQAVREQLQAHGLAVSMITGDFAVPENGDAGPGCLRRIEPYLDLCAAMGSDLIRVCLKTEDDIPAAQRAADAARERGLRLAHQSHTLSLFETVAGSLAVLARIDRPNFGLIYEPANLALCGEDYGLEALRRLQPHLFNVYLQNHVPDARGTLIMPTWTRGDVPSALLRFTAAGGIDVPGVIAALKAVGYAGYVTLHHTQLDVVSPLEAARGSADFLRSLL